MDNSIVINVNETLYSTEENDKEETNIVTDEVEENDKLKEDIIKQSNDTKLKSNDKITVNFENELAQVIVNTEQQINEFKHDSRNQKPPTIWVQYNQAYPQGQGYGQGYPQGKQYNYDGGGGGGHYGGDSLDYNPETRNVFVKLVFSLLLIMLTITAGIGIFILTTPNIKSFYQANGLFLMIASMVIMLGMNYVMACAPCSRVPPCNFISLFVIVMAMSNLVGAVTVHYRTHILIHALIATVVTVAVCIILACSRFDFTKWYLYVVVIAVAFSAMCLVVSVTMLVLQVRYKPLQIVMLFCGALINVVILVMELQMILGGRAIELGEDDYALAAYLLYSSIIDIFLKIVQLMGLLDGD